MYDYLLLFLLIMHTICTISTAVSSLTCALFGTKIHALTMIKSFFIFIFLLAFLFFLLENVIFPLFCQATIDKKKNLSNMFLAFQLYKCEGHSIVLNLKIIEISIHTDNNGFYT